MGLKAGRTEFRMPGEGDYSPTRVGKGKERWNGSMRDVSIFSAICSTNVHKSQINGSCGYCWGPGQATLKYPTMVDGLFQITKVP